MRLDFGIFHMNSAVCFFLRKECEIKTKAFSLFIISGPRNIKHSLFWFAAHRIRNKTNDRRRIVQMIPTDTQIDIQTDSQTQCSIVCFSNCKLCLWSDNLTIYYCYDHANAFSSRSFLRRQCHATNDFTTFFNAKCLVSASRSITIGWSNLQLAIWSVFFFTVVGSSLSVYCFPLGLKFKCTNVSSQFSTRIHTLNQSISKLSYS